MSWVKTVTIHDNSLNLTVERGEQLIPKLVNFAQENGIEITSVNLHKPSLEDVFLHFTGKTIRERETTRQDKNREFARRRARMRR
jgi:ABC-2 type transport system ATP-binding protein